ncbi:hypothetical protein [Herpetosiphon gulosus]
MALAMRFGWTYEQIRQQPAGFIDELIARANAESDWQAEEQGRGGRNA